MGLYTSGILVLSKTTTHFSVVVIYLLMDWNFLFLQICKIDVDG